MLDLTEGIDQRLQAGGTTLSPSDQKVFVAAMSAMNEGDSVRAETLLGALHVRYPEDFEINEVSGLCIARRTLCVSALIRR